MALLIVACSNDNYGSVRKNNENNPICTQVVASMCREGDVDSCIYAGDGCQISDLEAQGYLKLDRFSTSNCLEQRSVASCQPFPL